MLSRVADSLYWTSRYLERAEHTVRLLDINLGLMLDKSHTSAERRWQRVLAALGNPPHIAWDGDAFRLVQSLCFETASPASVVNCIIAARENARQIREEISTEQWQRLNRLFHEVSSARSERYSDLEFAEFLPAVIDGVHLFQGVTDTTLSHGGGWQFLQVGCSLERASATALLLDVYHREVVRSPEEAVDAHEYLEWVGLLKCCTAFEAYCKVYTADLQPERIAEFLILNTEFPRSIHFCARMVQDALNAIAEATQTRKARRVNRLAGRWRSTLGFSQIDEIMASGLHAYLEDVQRQRSQILSAIHETYIVYPIESELA